MEQILEKLFESVPKVRLLRLFVRNPEQLFAFAEVVKKTSLRAPVARKELKKLLNLELVAQKVATLREETAKGVGTKKHRVLIKTRKVPVFYANLKFRLLPELKDLITKDSITPRKKLLRQLQKLGSLKLVVLSGIFLNSELARTDLLIVGDNVKRMALERLLAEVESDLGRAVQYTLMESKEYEYRINMYDRFLRDIFELPHEKLINKLGA